MKNKEEPSEDLLGPVLAKSSPVQRELITTNQDGTLDVSVTDNSPKILLGVVVCDSMKQVMSMSRHYIRAGMIPRGLEGKSVSETESRVAVAIEYGLNIGLTPLQALGSVMIVNNRPCLWGDAPMSMVAQHKDYGGTEVKWIGQGDELTVSFTVFRIIRDVPNPYTTTFSVADAKKAGLWGKPGPWSSYPKRMMLIRARAFALRDAFPDALRGAGIAEELETVDQQAEATNNLQAKLNAIAGVSNELDQNAN